MASSFFRSFYVNRIRRILPASLAALLVTIGVGWVLFRNERAWSTTVDGAWSALFSGNWRFALNGTDYWAQDQATSPLQHFWSLGVEEQFYFVWPFVIFAGIAVFKSRRALGWIMGAIVVASLAWALMETVSNASIAYFSTFTRAWELGIGALLAIVAPVFQHITRLVRTILAWVGLTGIAASIALINPDMPFPGPWAISPVLATALVIAAGTGGSGRFLAPLTNPAMSYIGDLSFSLYLWHFPVIIFLEEFISEWHWTYYPIVFGLMLLLSVASYHLIEEPIRHSRLLLNDKGRERKKLIVFTERTQLTAVAALVVTFAGALLTTFTGPPLKYEASAPSVVRPSMGSSGTNPVPASADRPALGALQAQILTASQAAAWPVLSPSLDEVASKGSPDERRSGCAEPRIGPDVCNFDSGKDKTAVVFSDSTGVALISTIRAAIGDQYNVRGFSMAGCVSIDLTTKDDREQLQRDCANYKASAVEEINRMQPDLVFITNTTAVLGDVIPAADGLTGEPAWKAATQRTVDKLQPSGSRIVLVTSAPVGKTITACATRVSVPSNCASKIDPNYNTLAVLGSQIAGAEAIDTRLMFCTESGYCPAFIDGAPIKMDTVHVTEEFSRKMAPAFRESVTALLG
ncbi:hypothetical protein AR689_19230 [Arthrobacter sp. EpRS71]|nr:hypothetical protein AR689_19230 [Arthrobacter sp. EpRS71]